ncbi:uncharacterized protein LTR77_003583 [Saxophila tyrrhenica]|uniref:DUF202 domain-containing protein n=1 Tax=Saxophila tyrrhenica TaxID=1690608 RepID=A0AAV9PHG9_9PEZI|nr:hypothetical protein LTR77_003583 [Saxophila tyrrhenica]
MAADRPNDAFSITTLSTVHEPEPAHIDEQRRESDDELEATELRQMRGDKPARLSRVITPGKPLVHWYDPVKKFWRHQIRISVPHVDCRDHLANERTFLGYLRTSVALSMIGAVIAQLYRLQHRPNPDDVFGYYVLSKPLAGIFQGAALIVVLLGGIRFWRQQNAMAIGKVHAGGFELIGSGILSLVLLFGVFIIHVALDAYKEDKDEP